MEFFLKSLSPAPARPEDPETAPRTDRRRHWRSRCSSSVTPPSLYPVGFIDQLDNIIYDARLQLTHARRGVDQRIVILDIDEKSLRRDRAAGPGARSLMARLDRQAVRPVRRGGRRLRRRVGRARHAARASTCSTALAQKELRDVAGLPDGLPAAARASSTTTACSPQAIKGRPVVLGYYFNSEDNAVSDQRDSRRRCCPRARSRAAISRFTAGTAIPATCRSTMSNAAGARAFQSATSTTTASCAACRCCCEFDGAYYEVAVARHGAHADRAAGRAAALPAIEPVFAPERFVSRQLRGLEWIKVGPAHHSGRRRGGRADSLPRRQAQLPYISLADVVERPRQARAAARARSRSSAPPRPACSTCARRRSAASIPGVEIHANLIAGMLDRKIKQKPPYMLGAEVVLLLIGGVALALLIPMLSALWATARRRGRRCALIVGVQLLRLVAGRTWCCRSPASVLMTGALYTHEHGLRLLRRVALQAPVHRAVRPVRAARAGRRDGRATREVQHGAEGGRADDPVLATCAASPASRRRSSPRSCASTSTST